MTLNQNTTNATPLVDGLQIIEKLSDYLNLIIALVIVGGFLVGVFKYKPKATPDDSIEYLDAADDLLVQQKGYKLYWGRIFFLRKIKIPSTYTTNTICFVSYKPAATPRAALSKENFEEAVNRSHKKKIRLTNKKFFVQNDVEKVFVLSHVKVDSEYKKNIKVRRIDNVVEVYNENTFEVKNFRIDLDKPVSIPKVKANLEHIADFHPNDQGKVVSLTLGSIDAKDATIPGKVILIF
jgi:hypothetical protein